MTRWSLVGIAGCVLSAACGGVIDASTADATPDAPSPRDASTAFDSSIGPADSSVTIHDAPAPFDSTIVSFDATVGFDASPQDVTTTMSCAANTPFMPIPWAPPTPLRQGVCTPAQVNAYVTTLSTQNGPWTSGAATCDACLQTDSMAPAHGPIITQPFMGKETPTELNFGGCIANIDGMKAKGGCGNQLNNNNDCVQQECASCPDFMMPSPGGLTALCTQQVAGAGGACASDMVAPACGAEETADGGFQACVSSIQNILNLWCGP
jgi:hypothetical protein